MADGGEWTWADWLRRACVDGDALLFATHVLGFLMPGDENPTDAPQLDPWCVEALTIFSEQFNNRNVTPGRLSIRAGHGVGKTAFLCIILLFMLFAGGDDVKIPVVSSSKDQLRDGMWAEISKWLGKMPDDLRAQVVWAAEKVALKINPEGVFATARTASKHKPEALQGIHANTVLAIFDEASGIPEETYEASVGTLSTKGAMAVAMSNPTRRSGFFYKTHTDAAMRAEWRTMRVNCEDVPRARGHIQSVINLYGKDSNRYRVRVLGEFPTKDDDTVIALELVEAAKGRKVEPLKVHPIWGLDPARFGDDRSCLMKREGNRTLGAPKVWQNKDGAQLCGLVVAEYKATPVDMRPKAICVDVIGIGASAVDFLKNDGTLAYDDVQIVSVNVAESPSISDTNHRLRDELWWTGREWFAARDCCIDTSYMNGDQLKLIEEFIGELTTPTYTFTAGGKRIILSKADMKKDLGRSPDIADAFLMTFAAPVFPREADRHRDWDAYDKEYERQNPWAA